MAAVRLSHLADTDLDGIRDYISRDNPRAANDTLDRLFEALETLASDGHGNYFD